jgi:hypothetical protein
MYCRIEPPIHIFLLLLVFLRFEVCTVVRLIVKLTPGNEVVR